MRIGVSSMLKAQGLKLNVIRHLFFNSLGWLVQKLWGLLFAPPGRGFELFPLSFQLLYSPSSDQRPLTCSTISGSSSIGIGFFFQS